jgi:hypothetical protein
MALVFGAGTGDRVTCGSAAVLDDNTTHTNLLWVYPTTLTDDRFFISKHRGSTATGWFFALEGTGGNIRTVWERATTDLDFISSNTPLVTLNKWYFVASTINQGANAGKMYVGDLTTAPVEVTYGTSNAGSGAYGTDAARVFTIGNNDAPSPALAFQGRIAMASHYNRVMTLAEIRSQWWRFSKESGCEGLWQLGYNGTSSQPDYSGNFNAGTVTGATVAPHAPVQVWGGALSYSPYVVAVASGWAHLLSGSRNRLVVNGT